MEYTSWIILLFLVYNTFMSLYTSSILFCHEKKDSNIVLKNAKAGAAGAIFAHMILTFFFGLYLTLRLYTEDPNSLFIKMSSGLALLVYLLGFVAASMFISGKEVEEGDLLYTAQGFNFIYVVFGMMMVVTQFIQIYFLSLWIQ